MKKLILRSILFVFILSYLYPINAQIQLDTVKSQKFDTGKMWSFDYPPTDYLDATYNFKPDQNWFDDVRLSALRLRGCTSSFVSEDGLMMTNHHCVRGYLPRIQKEGEDLVKNGFYAKTLDEERKMPGYIADQLVFIKDVTDEVQKAAETGANADEKAANKEAKIKELTDNLHNEKGLIAQVVSLFNGAKYSLYGYKRYDDVRLVFTPDMDIAYFGGDFDNFTYPRYNLDCSFLRAYENGKPVNSTHFFKFYLGGIKPGEPIFSIGNPGSTQRLKTVEQLEFIRDYVYKNSNYLYNTLYDALEALKKVDPSRAEEFENMKVGIGNGQKVISSIYKGLCDPYLMARKRDFQKKLQDKVWSNPELKKQYGKIWENIADTRVEMEKYQPKISALTLSRRARRFYSHYFYIAQDMYNLAKELQKPEAERDSKYKGEELEKTIESIYPIDFDKLVEDTKLWIQADYIRMNLGDDDPLVKEMFADKKGKEAAAYLLAHSVLGNREKAIELMKKGGDAIINSGDPMIDFVKESEETLPGIMEKAKEIANTEQVFDDMLGQAIFKIYGTSIPPDANFTLRLSDGVLASFNYNGTKAPLFTTFYGLYNRWYSFFKQYPWSLHERWQTIPSDFDLSTPLNFISTNDIVGGNSGSAIINKNAEVVGLAFDGQYCW